MLTDADTVTDAGTVTDPGTQAGMVTDAPGRPRQVPFPSAAGATEDTVDGAVIGRRHGSLGEARLGLQRVPLLDCGAASTDSELPPAVAASEKLDALGNTSRGVLLAGTAGSAEPWERGGLVAPLRT
mmetsp:Transcript_59377/g.103920  ORF Transcript_59377/g.103920 Transcript_59377/m.103920 type:complete len:127 (-) Transcript_59377:52-432(-)